MAKKISQLTQATEVKSDDVTVIVQDGETKKIPLNMMVTKQDIENKKIAGLAKLDEIEATYENDTYTPTITVKNKSSVKVGEGDGVDYSANVMDGHAKSAILKGQTLVNLFKNKVTHRDTGKFIYVEEGDKIQATFKDGVTDGWIGFSFKENVPFEIGKTYTVMNELYKCDDQLNSLNISLGNKKFVNTKPVIGINKLKIIIPSDYTEGINWMYYNVNNTNNSATIFSSNLLILEGDYTQEDIPYFEGMQSVKMPVLTTTGKNLLDPNYLKNQCLKIDPSSMYSNGEIVFNANVYHLKRLVDINFESNTQYAFNFKMKGNANTKLYIKVYYKDGSNTNHFPYINESIDVISGTTKKNATVDFITISYGSNNTDCILYLNECSLFKSDIVTSHEPYKSNILSTSEDVVLRKVGDVQDELDLLTGEVVERIGYADINSFVSLSYRALSDNQGYMAVIALKNKKITTDLASNLVKVNALNNTDFGMYNNPSNVVVFRKNCTLDELKLIINQIQIVYELATESIKTVDLMPSGTHPSTTPYCWKNGHIQLSSSGLLPNLEYSVVTSRAGQINQNATMIVKNDKRIFDLEILLAGGLVNTTYQALTLQNQVETGLSKVSLSSETEPDYLLYHMIMKLIEEKAYKLDDLTEKVSVFYLYEKLSDEQFETIYSALYPFVEDEIIEEPVVEELPEVVEDEVIM